MLTEYELLCEKIANQRFRVEPTGRGFWPYCVRAGNGTMELFIGHKGKCEEVAQALQTACLDGAFMMKEALATPSASAGAGESLYLLQDTRSYVGNCPMWWRKGGNGYTTMIDEAERYTLAAAVRQHLSRGCDLPWLASEIEPLARRTVDVQDMHKLRSNEAQAAAIAQQGATSGGETRK